MKKSITIGLLCCIFCPLSLSGQNTTLPDSNYIDRLIEQARSADTLATERITLENALAFARQTNYSKGIWESMILLFEIEKDNDNLTIALRYALLAIDELKKTTQQSTLANVYNQVGQLFQSEQLFEAALKYYKSAELLTVTTQREALVKNIGNCYLEMSIPDSADLYFNQLLTYYRANNNIEGQIYSHRKMVVTAQLSDNIKGALTQNLAVQQLIDQGYRTDLKPIITNNIGYNYFNLGDFEKALSYFEEAITFFQSSSIQLGTLYNNIGIAYHNLGQTNTAIQNLLRARSIFASNGAPDQAARVNDVIASIYLQQQDLYNALTYNSQSIEGALTPYAPQILVGIYQTASEIHEALYDYKNALDYFERYLTLKDSLAFADQIRQTQLIQQQRLLNRSEQDVELLLINQEVQNLQMEQMKKNQALQEAEIERQRLENIQVKQQIQTQEQAQAILQLENDKAKQALQATQQRLLAQIQADEIERLERDSTERAQLLRAQALEAKNQEQQIQNLENEQQLAELRIQNQSIELDQRTRERRFITGLSLALLLILGLILAGLIYSRRINRQLGKQNKEIERQKGIIEKSRDEAESLLLNILPQETANELKSKGVATPKYYESVTVLFSDFSGFTRISEQMTPQELVDELNTCFRVFDDIVDQYGLEKIKTIGDGYMCAGGIPQSDPENGLKTLRAGIAMMAFIKDRRKKVLEKGLPYWHMRVGLHTGPVVAGVVGKNKFAYDIWGDTVNTASRMESHGEAGKINISESTYEQIKSEYSCTPRGAIEVKNKGKIDMYFVEV